MTPTHNNTTTTSDRPKVVLLGWLGCKPRHLQKYGEMYDNLGFHAFCLTDHCGLSTVFNIWMRRYYAKKLLMLLEKENPVAVHIFSNGGALVWREALAMTLKKKKIHGSSWTSHIPRYEIVDSCPGSLEDPLVGLRVLNALAGSSILTKILLCIIYPFIYLPLLFYYPFRLCFPSISIDRWYRRGWAMDAISCGITEHLLLYSGDDIMIGYQHVQEFRDYLLNHTSQAHDNNNYGAVSSSHPLKPVNVKEKFWPNGTHVQHYREHPTEYKETITGFLADIKAN